MRAEQDQLVRVRHGAAAERAFMCALVRTVLANALAMYPPRHPWQLRRASAILPFPSRLFSLSGIFFRGAEG
ncbi:hypothetical protein UB46_06760 [Burkholderiaceae bacterium 16]|nr:hypothetical protein UB46_06760 [Burkholderiaceae bacterium 16]